MRFYVIFALALGGLFLFPFCSEVYAEESYEYSVETDGSLFVDAIEFEQRPYNAGETVTGTFQLFNTGNEPLTGVQYRVELIEVTEYDGIPFPSEPFDASALVRTEFLDATSAQRVSFVYTLPTTIPDGTLALAIQTYVGNTQTPSAHEYKLITINGDRSELLESTAVVLINDTEAYEPLEGPTVQPLDTLSLQVILRSANSISLVPTVRLYRGNSTNAPIVSEEVLPSRAIAENEYHVETFSVPLKTLESDIYTALISFSDPTGSTVVAPTEFRFITGNISPKIAGVTYSGFDLVSSDTFTVSVLYHDVPFNIRINEDGVTQDKKLEALFKDPAQVKMPTPNIEAVVRLKNALTEELLSEGRISFTTSENGAYTFQDTPKGVNMLRVEVDLLKQGEIIDSFFEVIEVTTSPYSNIFERYWHEHTFVFINICIALIVVLVGVLMFTVRRSQKRVNAAQDIINRQLG